MQCLVCRHRCCANRVEFMLFIDYVHFSLFLVTYLLQATVVRFCQQG